MSAPAFLYGALPPRERVCTGDRSTASQQRNAESDAAFVRRALRAAGTVSLGEDEFVRRARRSGAMLEPRFDLAATPGVVGYSVRWRDRYSRTGPSIPDNALPPDLQLSELRFGWGEDPSAQIAAVAEWSQPRSHPQVARDTITMRPSWLWMRALTDAYNFQRSLLEYRPDEQQAWWWAAARVSGVISLWSQRTEIELGPLARAAEELSRFSYRSGSRCRPTRPRPASDLGHVALVLGHLQSEDHMVEGLLWGQLIAAARAIARAYGGRGEAQSAVDLEKNVVRPLTWARLAMGAGTGRTDGASS